MVTSIAYCKWLTAKSYRLHPNNPQHNNAPNSPLASSIQKISTQITIKLQQLVISITPQILLHQSILHTNDPHHLREGKTTLHILREQNTLIIPIGPSKYKELLNIAIPPKSKGIFRNRTIHVPNRSLANQTNCPVKRNH